jgi:6-phosphogluconolactonase
VAPVVETFSSRGALFRAGAELFVAAMCSAVEQRKRFSVALSGGSTPKGLYELLAQPPFGDSLPWKDAHVFWGDERCVPPDHPDSNYRMAREALLSKVPIPEAQVHRMRGEDDPDAAAKRYEKELRDFFGDDPRFDLALEGLGSEGHTASLFPGSAALDAATWTAAPFVEKLGQKRITLTPAALNRSREVLFLVAGADKRDAVRATLDKGTTPAARIRPADGEVYWLLDLEAAPR